MISTAQSLPHLCAATAMTGIDEANVGYKSEQGIASKLKMGNEVFSNPVPLIHFYGVNGQECDLLFPSLLARTTSYQHGEIIQFFKRKPVTESEIIKALELRVQELENKLFRFEQSQMNSVVINYGEIKDLSLDEIKQQVLEYYNTHKIVYPSDIACEFNFDLEKVVTVINDLISEGKVIEVE